MNVRSIWPALVLATVMRVATAQQFVITQPDCIINFSFTASGQTSPTAPNNGLDNRNLACDTWNVTYANSGFTAISLALQGAPNSAGLPGAYSNGMQVQQTIITGVNPQTNTTGGFLWLTGYSPWVRMTLASSMGSGVVNGAAYGWRIPSASSNGAAAPASNVTIVGPLGQAVMASSIPVVIASNQSAYPVNATIVNPLGQTTMAASVSIVQPNNQTSGCTKTFVNLSGSGNTQIVAASGVLNIYICDLEFSTGTPEDFKLTEGTGANCGSGTADATALLKNISAWSLTPGGGFAGARITATNGDALCANQANAQAAGVTLWFLQQ